MIQLIQDDSTITLFSYHLFSFLLKYTWFTMLRSFLVCGKVIQLYIDIFHILFHYGLSQDIKDSSLCYIVGPCCLSILRIIVCVW